MARVRGMRGRAAPRSLAGDVAVVTGAGGQIGGALLDRLTAAGATAVGLDLPYQFFLALPYMVTLAALAGRVGRARAPAALALPWPRSP